MASPHSPAAIRDEVVTPRWQLEAKGKKDGWHPLTPPRTSKSSLPMSRTTTVPCVASEDVPSQPDCFRSPSTSPHPDVQIPYCPVCSPLHTPPAVTVLSSWPLSFFSQDDSSLPPLEQRDVRDILAEHRRRILQVGAETVQLGGSLCAAGGDPSSPRWSEE